MIALRLAEDPNVTVLLLEAGPHSGSLLSVPIAGPALQLTRLDWQYKTVPQKHACFGLKGRVSGRFKLYFLCQYIWIHIILEKIQVLLMALIQYIETFT